jgi:hypothetical protein
MQKTSPPNHSFHPAFLLLHPRNMPETDALLLPNQQIDSLRQEVSSLREVVTAQGTLLDILWESAGPSGSFRVYFRPERFRNEEELRDHLQSIVPSVHSVIVSKNGDDLVGESEMYCT